MMTVLVYAMVMVSTRGPSMVVAMTVVDCSTPKQSYWLLMQKVSELQDGEKMTKGKIYTSDQRDV